MRLLTLILLTLSTFAPLAANAKIKPLRLKLPTANVGLVTGKPEKFYMYTNRTVNGKATRPWTGGTWGYSRNLKNTKVGSIATKFHEGVDIAPVKRDSANRPLDIVQSIADGVIVYTNSVSNRSSYGKYIVVKHDWGYGPFYSLYAHLASVNCKVGQQVKAESPLGRLGYTGVGINITRAHLHLELGIMMHPEFSDWHKQHYPKSGNYHGAYNGINLNGLDIASLFLSNHKNSKLTIPEFLRNTPTYYKVTIPRRGPLSLCQNYPWLKKGDHSKSSPSWEISFSSSAFPLSVTPSNKTVKGPTVTSVVDSDFSHSYRSRGLLTGSKKSAKLSSAGTRHIQLIAGTFRRQNE